MMRRAAQFCHLWAALLLPLPTHQASHPSTGVCHVCMQNSTELLVLVLEGTKLLQYNLKVCIYNFITIRINGFRGWNQQQYVGRKLLHFCVSFLYDNDSN